MGSNRGRRLNPRPTGRPPATGRLARVEPRFRKIFDRVAAVDEATPGLTTAELAARLRMNPNTLGEALTLMRLHDPVRYQNRPMRGRPITFMAGGKKVTRRLSHYEFEAQMRIVEHATKTGILPAQVQRAIPGLYPQRWNELQRKLIKAGRLPPEVKRTPGTNRPKTLQQAHLQLVAWCLLHGPSDLDAIRNALNTREVTVGTRKVKIRIKDRHYVSRLKQFLRQRLARALAVAQPKATPVGGTAWDVSKQMALANYLSLTNAELARLGGLLPPEGPKAAKKRRK